MFCPECGHLIPEDSIFCEHCGLRLETASDEDIQYVSGKTQIESEKEISVQKTGDGGLLCPDGKYRWVYEFDMLKNPTILFAVWKVLAISGGIVCVIGFHVNLFSGDLWYGFDLPGTIRFIAILAGIMLVISIVGYLIVACTYGWKYMVLFTMDEDGVEHRQMKKQFNKAKALGWLSAFAGTASGNAGRVGTGILAATRDSSTSEFKNVRKVKAVRRRHVIYVNQLLAHNQVYAQDEDFDFVRNYIVEHCPNAKVSG